MWKEGQVGGGGVEAETQLLSFLSVGRARSLSPVSSCTEWLETGGRTATPQHCVGVSGSGGLLGSRDVLGVILSSLMNT